MTTRTLGFFLSLTLTLAPLQGCSIQSHSPQKCHVSVGLYEGQDPLHLRERPGNPIFTFRQVSDRKAWSVADPFIVAQSGIWYLFFEAIDASTGHGDIAVAESRDLETWKYLGIVLSESFHLSYPYVFQSEGQWYMIPESRERQSIRLYKATEFPNSWQFVKELIHGNYADPSIVQYNKKWWIFAELGAYSMSLFWADTLEGPWKEHRLSPIYTHEKSRARAGGRILNMGNRILRFPQDSVGGYGHQVRAFEIDTLTTRQFSEHEVPESPVLSPSGNGWRSHGMHQFDAHQLPNGTWLAVVDGCGNLPVE